MQFRYFIERKLLKQENKITATIGIKTNRRGGAPEPTTTINITGSI